jgi:hypothetical protein
MNQTPTAADVRESLTAHVEAKGIEIYLKYGPHLGWTELQRLLGDEQFVRYRCEIVFDASPLLPGEFAQPIPMGERPEDGFTMFVHPRFIRQLDRVPALVLYQLVVVNYGDFASPLEAETFGAAAMGLTRDEYYAIICESADRVGAGATVDEGCGCRVS